MRQMLIHKGNGKPQRATALAVLLALSLVLATCGESDQDATDDRASEIPTPTQAATHTPKIEPTSTPAPTATPQIEPTPTPAPTSTPQPEPTPTESASGQSDSSESLDIVEHLLETTSQFWETYNNYDIDTLKTFYEESYWSEQEAEVQSNMQPFKNFNLSITPEEATTPTEVAPGKWEIRQTASFAVGSVKMLFIYEEFDGDWLLTYAEAQ